MAQATMRLSSMLLVTAIFAAVGPFVGLLFWGGLPLLLMSVFLGGLPITAAYLLGLVPAAITGLLVAIQARQRNFWLYWLTAVGSGAMASAGFITFAGGSPAWRSPQLTLRIALVGAAAAAVCALIAMRPAGFRFSIPPRVTSITQKWDATSVLLAVLGLVCTFLLFQIGFMIFG